jgi:hypothetical protein
MTAESRPPTPLPKKFSATGRNWVTASLPGSSDRVAIMKLELKIPPEVRVSPLSHRRPELVIEAINIMGLPCDETIGEYEIYGPSADWGNEIATFPDVVEADWIGTIREAARFRAQYHRTPMISLVSRSAVHFRFPAMIRNGMMCWEIVAKRSRMDRVIRILEGAPGNPRLVPLNGSSLRPVPDLTSIQRSLFH